MNIRQQNFGITKELSIPDAFENFLTNDHGVIKLMHYARLLAGTDCNILITGETGTGKELFANAIHRLSHRREKRFVGLNINAIPEKLIESALFGHKKGAFTGAVCDQEGHFTEADEGTLFLDEIGDLPICVQIKLLRAIEDKKFFPVGSNKEIQSDFRLIAATNRNLNKDVENAKFRSDLYFRLSVGCIDLPPLRDRGNDITMIAQKLLGNLCKKNRIKRRFTPEALYRLQAYDFPGNYRELRNLVEYSFYKSVHEEITDDCLEFRLGPENTSSITETRLITLEELKLKHIETMVKIHRTRKGAARALGISVRQLYKYLDKINHDVD